MIRNLLFNCCPMESGARIWRDNIAWLNRYQDAFNGRKLVIVRTGDGIEPLAAVQAEFDFEVEFIELPNDPEIGESAGFIPVLGRLESVREDEVIFYAHSKGVSHPSRKQDPSILACVERWRDHLYHYNLRDIPRVEEVLSVYDACGCFLADVGGEPRRWMFIGAFWWAKSARIFSHPKWREIGGWQGTEFYLSGLIPVTKAYELYPRPLVAMGHRWYEEMLPETER